MSIFASHSPGDTQNNGWHAATTLFTVLLDYKLFTILSYELAIDPIQTKKTYIPVATENPIACFETMMVSK